MVNEPISNERKQQIKEHLQKYVDQAGSAKKASHRLTDVSTAYISHVLNDNWDPIADSAWRNIEAQVRLAGDNTWKIARTKNYDELETLIKDAKTYAISYGLVGDAGTGKTQTVSCFESLSNVFVLKCNDYHNKHSFLVDLLSALGEKPGGYTNADMMANVIRFIRKAEMPVIIMDEVDKLPDSVLLFFISLFNALEGQCGFLLMATEFLKFRIEKGALINKKGYREIYSRLGRKFVTLERPTKNDVIAVVESNGLFDKMAINHIWNGCDRDLRRVRRMVHANKRCFAENGYYLYQIEDKEVARV